MITLHERGVWLVGGAPADAFDVPAAEARKRTMAWRILQAHNRSGDPEKLRVGFDAMLSHDITYVGIIQQARASGMTEFPIPYALTNCHNSLCAVGGTINEDDHLFGLSAAKKYGGIYVPANQSVIHSYGREAMAKCGAMILGSDSHTRYGALGTMAVGEGGPELAKQLLRDTWDAPCPEVVLVYLTGTPRRGVGPHDVALALVKATFANGFVKNRVLEFAGPGVRQLPIDYRNGIDVMTTETTCLSSIWETDEETLGFYAAHGRPEDYCELHPADGAYYDRMVHIDLSRVEPMIALPFHPSNAYPIREFLARAPELLAEVEAEAKKRWPRAKINLGAKIRDGAVWADQGVIAGCSGGTFDNIDEAAQILSGGSVGCGAFNLSVYPTSVPVSMELTKIGATGDLLAAGAVIKPSFCGPCFGAGDVPANNGLSIRHTTRNFPNREGSKPGEGQFAGVCLMDARSIAATAANGGRITPATDVDYAPVHHAYHYDSSAYDRRVYNGFGHPQPETELIMGPNITDWPAMYPMSDNLLVELAAVIRDPVTTTDELIPSGETSSYRSNPAGPRPPPGPRPTAAPARPPRRCASSWPGSATPTSCWRIPSSAPACSPTGPATAPPGSRRPPARRCWAASPTSATRSPPSATAPTASTGASSPSPWTRTPCSPPRRATAFSSRISAPGSPRAVRNSARRCCAGTAPSSPCGCSSAA